MSTEHQQPPKGESSTEHISAHIEKYLGPVESVFHELVSDMVHIDLHYVKPTKSFPFIRLITSGMSDLPMATPEHPGIPKHVELLIALPADWPLDQDSLQDEACYWPIRLLKVLARLPHLNQTWLGMGHTVPNGDPMQPYAPNTKQCGAIILPSPSAPQSFHVLNIEDGKQIAFYAVIPLYEPEMNLKLRSGTGKLLNRLAAKRVSEAVDVARVDVSLKKWGLFWA